MDPYRTAAELPKEEENVDVYTYKAVRLGIVALTLLVAGVLGTCSYTHHDDSLASIAVAKHKAEGERAQAEAAKAQAEAQAASERARAEQMRSATEKAMFDSMHRGEAKQP